MSFTQTIIIALISPVLSFTIAYLVLYQQKINFKRETMAERAAQHFLKHKNFTDRSFKTLKMHLGGWDNNEDELRRILVRAGAIRTFRGDEEWWTLLSRWDERIDKIKTRHEN